MTPNALACSLRKFFGDHLPAIRGMSPHTIRSYRDSIALLLRFLATTTGRPVTTLDVPDLTVEHVVAFLHHVEQHRGVTATTRNVRLAALHTFARFLAAQEPIYLDQTQRILAIPFKRARPRPIACLEYEDIAAVRGRGQYFRISNAHRHFKKVDSYVYTKLVNFLWRNHKRRGTGFREFPPTFFKRAGLYQLHGTIVLVFRTPPGERGRKAG